MKTKHTPGPWRHKNESPELYDLAIYTGDYEGKHTLVAEVFGSIDGKEGYAEMSIPIIEKAEANAKLIAAAPELLEACQLAMQSDIDGSFVAASKWWKIMENAIQKATS